MTLDDIRQPRQGEVTALEDRVRHLETHAAEWERHAKEQEAEVRRLRREKATLEECLRNVASRANAALAAVRE